MRREFSGRASSILTLSATASIIFSSADHARFDAFECDADLILVSSEILNHAHFVIESDDCGAAAIAGHQRLNHSAHAVDLGEHSRRYSAALHRDHQRHRRQNRVGRIQMNVLANAIVGNDEILRGEAVDQVALLVGDGRGDQHQRCVGL